MPTTTNFGWTTPADTDLVKDGALAMRTLGNGIDTSMAQLKGGTTGQILSKTSNTDMAFTWINNDQGDLTAVSAGTGITVTSGTGPVPTVALTVPVVETSGGTNQTTYTTGDLLYASASNTLSKRAIGTTGQVLTVSGGVPTWATTSSSVTAVGCSLYGSGDFNASNTTWTLVDWASERWDTDGFHSTTTNTSRITIPSGKGGKYLVQGKVTWNTTNTDGRRALAVYKNGSDAGNIAYAPVQYTGSEFSLLVDCAAGDYLQFYVWQNSGGTLAFGTAIENGWFAVSYQGA